MVMREVDENLAIFLGIRNDAETKPETTHENFPNLELHNKSDYDWLLKQHVTSSFPSAYVKFQDSTENQTENSNDDLIFLKSELPLGDNSSEAPPARRRPSSSSSSSSSLGERKPTSRAATPTGGRPMKPKPSRASTLTSLKPMSSQKRTSTPSRATSHTSTAPSDSKPASMHVKPTPKPATPSAKSIASGSDRSSSGRKTRPTSSKNPVPSRGTSSQSKPPETLSSSHDATEIPITSLPKRPASAPKIRPSNCSVVRNGNIIMMSKGRGYSNDDGDDHVNPVVMGTKMVERVVNMRKLAPPKQDDCVSTDSVKKSSLENSGFGRSLSKKSLDMAIRHMDIRRSIPDDLRPMAAV